MYIPPSLITTLLGETGSPLRVHNAYTSLYDKLSADATLDTYKLILDFLWVGMTLMGMELTPAAAQSKPGIRFTPNPHLADHFKRQVLWKMLPALKPTTPPAVNVSPSIDNAMAKLLDAETEKQKAAEEKLAEARKPKDLTSFFSEYTIQFTHNLVGTRGDEALLPAFMLKLTEANKRTTAHSVLEGLERE